MMRSTGACLCGAVKFEVESPVLFTCFCYCQSCQLAAGAPVVAWATYYKKSFNITEGKMRWHKSSPGVTRGHCADCGSSITYENASTQGEIDININLMAESGRPEPQLHIWTQHKPDWLIIGDELPTFRGESAKDR